MNENYVTLGQVCTKGSSNIAQKDLAEREGQYPIYGAAGLIKNVDFAHQKQSYIAVVKDGAGIGRVMKLPAYSSVIGTMQYIFPKENVDIDYLFYALQHMNLGKYFSGSTIPHIYFRDYQKERLKLPVMEVQQRQADTLSRIDALSAYGQRQIALMDEIVKSRFVEMFGDPETNPYGWRKTTVGDVCSSVVRGPFGSALKKEFFVEPNGSTYKVYEQKHAIQKSATIGTYYISAEKFGELRRFECRPGDILMSCSGTMGELFQLPSGCERGVINQALCKFTLSDCILPIVFLTYMRQTIGNLETKGSGIQNIAAVSYVKAMPINLPPMEVQRRFAAFVAEVDKSKFRIQKSLSTSRKLWTMAQIDAIMNMDFSTQRSL